MILLQRVRMLLELLQQGVLWVLLLRVLQCVGPAVQRRCGGLVGLSWARMEWQRLPMLLLLAAHSHIVAGRPRLRLWLRLIGMVQGWGVHMCHAGMR